MMGAIYYGGIFFMGYFKETEETAGYEAKGKD